MYLNNFSEIDALVECVKNNDNPALWKLFDYYEPIVNSTITNVHKKYKTVPKEDLYSECVFILKDLCFKYDKEKSYFSYYLSTRLQPYLISKVKSNYLNKIDMTSLSTCDKEDLINEIDFDVNDSSYLTEEINKLPEKLQKAINLFYFEGLNQSECAIILKISQPAFSKQLKKALEILKKNISNWL